MNVSAFWHHRRNSVLVTARAFLALAAGTALYLACISFGRSALPGCPAASACQQVLQSKWGYAFGIPVSFFGLVLFTATLLRSGAFVRRERSSAGFTGGMCVVAAVAAAGWFTAIQLIALKAVCLWCLTAQFSGAAGALLLCLARHSHPVPDRTPNRPPDDRRLQAAATAAALAATAIVALGAFSRSGPALERGIAASARPPATAPASTPADPAPVTPPSIVMETPTVRLRELEPGKATPFQISIRNGGGSPLRIDWLSLDEGCEITALPETPISPGASATLSLRLTPSSGTQEFTRRVTVHSNSPGEPGIATIHALLKEPAATPPPPASKSKSRKKPRGTALRHSS